MAVATIYPEPAKYKRGAKSFAGKESGTTEASISKARTVLKVLPETARAAF